MKGKKYIALLIILLSVISCRRVSDSSNRDDYSSRLKQVIDRGVLRVVTDFNSTNYFIYRGQPMGYQFEMLQELADYLGVELEVSANNDLQEKFELLEDGDVDLIAVNLTVTRERREMMDFTVPHTQTHQVLIQRKPDEWENMSAASVKDSLIRNQLDLACKTIFVQRNSAYARRLNNLSDEIGDSIDIREVDEGVEQLIKMVAEGKIDYTVCDENLAMVNETYYNNIDVLMPVSFPQNLAWAVHKGADDLRESIDNWLTYFKNTSKYAVIYQKYFRNKRSAEIVESDYFTNASGIISPYDEIIKEQSAEIGWDWRLVASMIYQESRFNPNAKSWAGAYGLMQLMPNTAERFGVEPSSQPSQHIRAGIMFIKWLDDRLSTIKDPEERKKFVLASYNVGLGHVLDARALAEKNGFDPDIWENNVDQFMINKSIPRYYTDPVVKYGYCRGSETYSYVAGIYKRYEHYKNLVTR
ncbi:MAG: transporter substrate-binding domain-containing protein [Bacteroidales bacterium]